jgi:hypothetical protein
MPVKVDTLERIITSRTVVTVDQTELGNSKLTVN